MIYHAIIRWIKHNNWLIRYCSFANADLKCVGCFASKDQMKINLRTLLLVFIIYIHYLLCLGRLVLSESFERLSQSPATTQKHWFNAKICALFSPPVFESIGNQATKIIFKRWSSDMKWNYWWLILLLFVLWWWLVLEWNHKQRDMRHMIIIHHHACCLQW